MNKRLKVPVLEIDEGLFFLSYGIYIVFFTMLTSFYAKYIQYAIDYCITFCLFLLVLKELQVYNYTFKSFLILLITATIGLLMYYSGSAFFMIIFVFVYCGRNIRFERIAIFTIFVSSITVSFIILSSFLGIIENYSSMHLENNRYYLGFLYGLYASCYVFNITALFIYIKKEAIRWYQIFILFAVNYWLYRMSDARLSFYTAVILLVAALILKIFPRILVRRKIVCFAMAISWVLIAIFSIYAVVMYNGNVVWMKELDDFLGGRLYLGQKGFLVYGLSWFGQEVHWVGAGLNSMGQLGSGSYLYVDNLYVKIMIQYGIVFLLIYVILHTLVMWQSWKDKDYYLLVILTILAARCVVDDLSLNLYYNTFWFLIGSKLLNVGRKKLLIQNRLRNLSKLGG